MLRLLNTYCFLSTFRFLKYVVQMLKKLVLPLLLFLFAFSGFSQLSRIHYIPPLTSSDGFTDQYIYISTPNNNDVSYKITPLGNLDIPAYSGVVSNNNPIEQPILTSDGASNNFTANSQLHVPLALTGTVFTDRGFLVEAEDVVYVSVRVRSSVGFNGEKNHAGAFVSKGVSALGTEFRIGGFKRDNPRTGDLTFASIMATEDNTVVTIDDLPAGIQLVNVAVSSSINVTLNEGESYIISTATTNTGGNAADLIGGRIQSNKPVVVNCGSATGSFGTIPNNSDYGFDQIVGSDKIGTEYILVKGDGGNNIEKVIVLFSEDNTSLQINGNTAGTFNSGETSIIDGDLFSDENNMYIRASKPVFIFQGIGGTSFNEANQGLFFVPPLGCENKGDINNIAKINNVGPEIFDGGITIVTNRNAEISINDQSINDISSVSGPFDVTGKTDYVTYRVIGLSGNIKIQSDQELYGAYFNRNSNATTGAFYSGFLSPPEINFNPEVTNIGNCIPNVTLEAADPDLFDNFVWQFFDTTSSSWNTIETSATFKPATPGDYRLVGTVSCGTGGTPEEFISDPFPVSICPDDFDNDLIIDNLDIDLDNDGILNTDESLGNVTLNLTNINTPVLRFSNGDTNTSIATGSYDETEASNNLSGTNLGDFTSVLNPATDSRLSYTINFTEPVNFEMVQRLNRGHAQNSSEYFILKIAPNDKNITLLDPDDQLLIDTDFDGDFTDESSVTAISGSEIRFKYKQNITAGSATYKFIADQITEITFEHQSFGLTTPSSFNGNIKLTYFSLDTDNDGVPDARDADSDNDGIPDLIENAGQNITLSNSDSNQDGLDNVFDALTPIPDFDGDGIPNFLDLDSDNDGIYDVLEAGHTSANIDNDGIINGATSFTVGENGLFNNFESAPDSGILNYTIRDTNADNTFDFLSLDADGDGCFDVVEAGFTGNGSGFLSPDPTNVNANGFVIGSDGYGAVNTDYIVDGTITSSVNPIVEICDTDSGVITLNTDADSFQWQLSTDGGTNWTNINNDATYNNVTSQVLEVNNVDLTLNGNLYRVLQNKNGYGCDPVPSDPIQLTINALPNILTTSTSIIECISVLDSNPSVSLRGTESLISNTPNAVFEYYENYDGTNLSGLISNPDNYPFSPGNKQTFYVKVLTNKGCISPTIVDLVVDVGPINFDENLTGIKAVECDDLLAADGTFDTDFNNDTDFITNFSLNKTAIENEIFTVTGVTQVSIEYYENLDDRSNSINEIDITNFRNTISKNDTTRIGNSVQFPIYFKQVSNFGNNCEGLGSFLVQIDAVPTANTVSDIELCDDDVPSTVDGITTGINLQDKVDAILGTQDRNDFDVTFHTSEAGARGNFDVITNDTNFSNTVDASFTPGTINEQEIYVRVQSKTTGCFNANTSFTIRIYPIPTIPAGIQDILICDTEGLTSGGVRDRIANGIDLTVNESAILDGRTGYFVEYYISPEDATNRTNRILTPESYQNSSDPSVTNFPSNFNSDDPAVQTIFFIVVDENDIGCPSIFSTFQLFIYPEPFAEPITVYSDCDDDLDGDDTNGIIQNINLESKIPEILGNRNPNDYIVTFHNSQEDSDAAVNAISSPYTNQNPTETIFVRIQQKISGCVNTNESFEIIINPLPDFSVTSPQIVCLNDLPLTIFAENPTDIYDYQWLDPDGNPTGTNQQTLDVTKGGIYTVIATTTNGTNCSRTETIEVIESNVAVLEESFVTIIDEATNIGSGSNLSISIDVLSNDLGIGDYQFAIFNTETNERFPFAGFQDEPVFDAIEGGIYQIIVNDKNGCAPDATLLVSVIEFPKFFTPNGDGKNDFWRVKGADATFYPNTSMNVFNRFGVLIAQIPIDSQGWDGTYQGNQLPADDYWYSITLVPADQSKPTINKKGNFSLLRQ